jgi:hypothetical protein
MGYYVNALEGIITITPENVDKATEAINAKLEENYDSLENALVENKFEFEKDDDGYYRIHGFYAKWREQDNLLYAITSYMTEDSHMAFMGEESEIFVYASGGSYTGKIVWGE